jgi:hypothetical protein
VAVCIENARQIGRERGRKEGRKGMGDIRFSDQRKGRA